MLTDPVEDLKESVSASSGGGFKRSMSLRASGEIVLDRVQGIVIETLTIDKKALPTVASLADGGYTKGILHNCLKNPSLQLFYFYPTKWQS